MDLDAIVVGIVWYGVLLLSLTAHEAAHALAALRGGDPTAYLGGQVTLDPSPHMRREPFGMVIVPIAFYLMNGFMIGWASTPFDPAWAERHPRRAAWMSLAAAGALCSTIGDLVRWNRALHTGKVVSAASYTLMTMPEGAAKAGALAYGFGLGRAMMGERVVITHGGGIPGFITANAWIPSLELSITVLTNSGGAKPDDLMRQLARAAAGMSPVQPANAVPRTTP